MRKKIILPDPAAATKLLIAAGTLIGAMAMPLPASAGESCSLKCDIVYNRSGSAIKIARNSDSWWRCANPHPQEFLANGGNSNQPPLNWQDTDCVNVGWRIWPGNNWRRVHGPVWIY